jgi:hypothetical protein
VLSTKIKGTPWYANYDICLSICLQKCSEGIPCFRCTERGIVCTAEIRDHDSQARGLSKKSVQTTEDHFSTQLGSVYQNATYLPLTLESEKAIHEGLVKLIKEGKTIGLVLPAWHRPILPLTFEICADIVRAHVAEQTAPSDLASDAEVHPAFSNNIFATYQLAHNATPSGPALGSQTLLSSRKKELEDRLGNESLTKELGGPWCPSQRLQRLLSSPDLNVHIPSWLLDITAVS